MRRGTEIAMAAICLGHLLLRASGKLLYGTPHNGAANVERTLGEGGVNVSRKKDRGLRRGLNRLSSEVVGYKLALFQLLRGLGHRLAELGKAQHGRMLAVVFELNNLLKRISCEV